MGCRNHEDLLHHVFQCLSQLASLTGAVFDSDKGRALYITVFASELLEYIKKYDLFVICIMYVCMYVCIIVHCTYIHTYIHVYGHVCVLGLGQMFEGSEASEV